MEDKISVGYSSDIRVRNIRQFFCFTFGRKTFYVFKETNLCNNNRFQGQWDIGQNNSPFLPRLVIHRWSIRISLRNLVDNLRCLMTQIKLNVSYSPNKDYTDLTLIILKKNPFWWLVSKDIHNFFIQLQNNKMVILK